MGTIKFITSRNVNEVIQACKAVEICGFDSESTSLHPRNGKLRLIQLAPSDAEGIVYMLDCFSTDPRILAPIFDGSVRLIGHNLAHDFRFLAAHDIWPLHGKKIFDSMIAGQLLDAGIKTPKGWFSLAEMHERLMGMTMDKELQRSNWAGDLSQDQLIYAAKDALNLIPLYYKLKDMLIEANLQRTMLLEMRALPGMVWMTMQGIGINVDGWKKLAHENREKVENLEQGLADVTDTGDMFGFSSINWRSPKQVEATFNKRFIEQGKTYKVKVPIACQESRCKMFGQMYEYETTLQNGDTVSEMVPVCSYHSTFTYEQRPVTMEGTGSRVLAQLAADGDQLAALLMKYRKTVKSRDTYGIGFLDKYLWIPTGRIYPEYHQLGAGATGRMSSSNPNGQNIPHSFDFRSLFIPTGSNKFSLADLSQIELRICVEISRDPAGWDAYVTHNTDLHRKTAELILGLDLRDTSEANLKRIKEGRQVAKSLNFGLIFGAGSETLRLYAQDAFGVILTAGEAEKLRNAWRNTYAGIVAWQRRAGNGPTETRTLGNRRRINVFKFTEKLNSPVQGTGIDGLKAGVALCYERRHEINSAAFPVAYVHDEILFEAPEHAATDVSLWIQRNMEEGMSYFLKEVPVLAEAKVADNWGEK